MRTHAQKQNPTQKGKIAVSTRPGRTLSGQSREVSSYLHLQHTIGNQAVQRLLQVNGGHPLPASTAKLRVTPPHDPLEAEADRMADAIVNVRQPNQVGTSSSTGRRQQLSRQSIDTEEALEKSGQRLTSPSNKLLSAERVPGSVTPRQVASRASVVPEGGRPLSAAARTYFEPRFGYDFSNVRVHDSPAAASSARALGARAYTVGNDIVFGSAEHTPQNDAGRRLMAHELIHVIQQQSRDVSLMRACNCTSVGGRNPTTAEARQAHRLYPNLVAGDWCVSAPATATYNCHAFSVGITNRWIDTEIDTVHGNNNGSLDISDFDAFFTYHGYPPATNYTAGDGRIVIYGAGSSDVKHSAVKTDQKCDGEEMFESKRGRNIRILHKVRQLAGGFYGNILKFYP